MLGFISPRENIKGEFAADILRHASILNTGVETEESRTTSEFINSEEDGITIEWN